MRRASSHPRNDSRMCTCCSYKTLHRLNPQRSHSSSCYYHQDLHQRGHSTQAYATNSITRPHAHPSHECNTCTTLVGCQSAHLSTIHFRGQPIRQGSYHTLLSGFKFHDRRPAVQVNQHPSWYRMSRQLSTCIQH